MRYYTLEEVRGIRDGIKGLGNEPEEGGGENERIHLGESKKD